MSKEWKIVAMVVAPLLMLGATLGIVTEALSYSSIYQASHPETKVRKLDEAFFFLPNGNIENEITQGCLGRLSENKLPLWQKEPMLGCVGVSQDMQKQNDGSCEKFHFTPPKGYSCNVSTFNIVFKTNNWLEPYTVKRIQVFYSEATYETTSSDVFEFRLANK
jgi:hypothetical protein